VKQRLHALTVLGHDADGTRYRHELVMAEVRQCSELCAECGGFAAVPHPRAKVKPELYAGVELLERCRGLALCQSPRCQALHTERHDRALHEQEQRERAAAEPARGRGRSAA
jgi:hypothetical protein